MVRWFFYVLNTRSFLRASVSRLIENSGTGPKILIFPYCYVKMVNYFQKYCLKAKSADPCDCTSQYPDLHSVQNAIQWRDREKIRRLLP